jgi:hypothetical protein
VKCLGVLDLDETTTEGIKMWDYSIYSPFYKQTPSLLLAVSRLAKLCVWKG